MSRTPPGPHMRDLAQRLLAYEAAAGAGTPPALLVSDKLRRLVSTLAGDTGFRSLLTRALVLAKNESPALAAVQLKPDGSLEGLTENHAEDAVLLIAQLLALLMTFIGEPLMLRLVLQVWPDLQPGDNNPGEIK